VYASLANDAAPTFRQVTKCGLSVEKSPNLPAKESEIFDSFFSESVVGKD
jgi:hypothetical protein